MKVLTGLGLAALACLLAAHHVIVLTEVQKLRDEQQEFNARIDRLLCDV